MRSLFVAWLVPVLVSCSNLPPTAQRTPSGQSDFPERIIDAHVHLDGVWTSGDVREFEINGVEGVVAHTPHGKLPTEASQPFPFKVRLCAGIDERSVFRDVEAGLRTKRLACLKIYLGYVRRWASDPLYLRYYRLAEKYNVPVVLHTGDTYLKTAHVKYTDPMTIDEVAVSFPKVRFVLAHLGNPWFSTAAEVAYKNDNVYLDTSALMLGDISTATTEQVHELIVRPLHWMFLYVENPTKFLFGTDWALCKIGPYVEAVKRAIPPQHWRAVFHDNAAELFSMPTEVAPK